VQARKEDLVRGSNLPVHLPDVLLVGGRGHEGLELSREREAQHTGLSRKTRFVS
jgi:hypothetical protein